MKLSIFLFFMSLYTHAATLPKSWVSETVDKSNALASVQELIQARSYLDSVLGIQEKVLLSQKDINHDGFKFSHYITDFSVSKSGLFGLSALNARSAVEIKWQKVANLIEPVTLEAVEVLDDSESGLSLTATQIEAMVLADGKIAPHPDLKNNIVIALLEAKKLMDGIHQVEIPGWRLAALRLDLSFGANGKVWPFANAGASTRIRLDWKKVKRPSIQKSMLSLSKKTSRLISKILFDLNEVYAGQDVSGFKIKLVNIGIGFSHKGNLFGIASVKKGFVGYLRFEPVNKPLLLIDQPEDSIPNEDMELVVDESQEKMNIVSIPRKKWRAGLKRSLEMANFFAGSASRFNNHWKVTELKTVFELTKSGFLGLAGTSGMGAIETELVRK